MNLIIFNFAYKIMICLTQNIFQGIICAQQLQI